MYWNHRVVRVIPKDKSRTPEFEIVEAYYDGDFDPEAKPHAYGRPFLNGDTVEELKETAARMVRAFNRPVIDIDEKDSPSANNKEDC